MAHLHLLLPAVLGGINGQKSNQAGGVLRDVVGHSFVIDPEATDMRLAAKDEGAGVGRGGGPVGLILGAQVHDMTGTCTPCLKDEVLCEVGGEVPGVGVNIDDDTKLVLSSGDEAIKLTIHFTFRVFIKAEAHWTTH